MEENINIFALVLDELNKNDMWFTTKADPTAEEASSYYKLDEYGEPTEATVKKIEKEVTSLIGDGAVDIYDAVELWVNDALVAFRIDYKDNLVTQFEDKPVVDNIEAYENPVQFPQSKKVESLSDNMTENDIKNIKKAIEELKTAKFTEFTEIYRNNNLPPQVENYCEATMMDDSLNDVDSSGDYVVNEDQMRAELIKTLSWFLPRDKQTEAKTKKTEGAGAGYEIRGTVSSAKVNNYEVIGSTTNQYNEKIYELKCDIDVKLEDVQFESYYYGGKIDFPIDGKVTYLIVSENSNNDIDEDLTSSDIENALDGAKIKEMLGGGWVHETFTGDFSGEFDGDVYGDYYALDFEMTLTQEPVIDFIDKKVDGVMDEVTYCVYDKDNDPIDDFADKDEAIEFAKKNGYVEVVEKYHDYQLIDADGSIDDNSYEDGDIVWEREYTKQYKFDDEVEESKEVKTETYKPTEDEWVGKMKDTNGTFFDVYLHGDKFLDVLGNELSKEEVADYVKKYTKTEKMNGFNSENSIAEELFADLQEAEDIDTEKWNNSNSEERVAMVRPIIIKFYKENRDKIDDNWDDFMELLTYWNYHTEYKIFNDLSYDEILNVEESKKVESLDGDNHEYISIYDEINELLGLLVNDEKSKLELYNNFNTDKPLKDLEGDNEDIYYDWLDDFRLHNYRELKDYLDELDDIDQWENSKIFDENKKAERKRKQIEAFKNRKVNFNKRTKEENYQRRLDEVNNKSKNLISDLFSSNDFDSDSPAGQIVMRTSQMFNALSDKGYDVEVTFDNGESTSAIQLGQQGGKVMITITNTDQPLRAFTSGNFEITDQNIKTLQDIQSQIEVL